MAAWALWELGYPDQALRRTHEALSLARELSQPLTTALALSFAAFVHYHRGESAAALEKIEAMATLTEALGLPAWADQAASFLAVLRLEQGGDAGSLAPRQGRLTLPTTVRWASWRQIFSLALLAGAYGRAGQSEAGLEALSEAWGLAGGNPEWFYAPELHRLKGELLLTRGTEARGEAEACFRRAIEIARARQARSLELRAVMSLSRLLARLGQRDDAREMLAEIYRWFTEGFDTKDLREAKALLDEL